VHGAPGRAVPGQFVDVPQSGGNRVPGVEMAALSENGPNLVKRGANPMVGGANPAAGEAAPMLGGATVTAGFAPPAAGFGEVMAGFAALATGFATPAAGFAPPAAGFAPSATDCSSRTIGAGLAAKAVVAVRGGGGAPRWCGSKEISKPKPVMPVAPCGQFRERFYEREKMAPHVQGNLFNIFCPAKNGGTGSCGREKGGTRRAGGKLRITFLAQLT
jgi:hypothetical protein